MSKKIEQLEGKLEKVRKDKEKAQRQKEEADEKIKNYIAQEKDFEAQLFVAISGEWLILSGNEGTHSSSTIK